MNNENKSKKQLVTDLEETSRRVSELEESDTKLKHAEKTLGEIEQKFQLLVDHTFDWEYWIDQNGEYVYLSPSCERITGYTPEEFISNPSLLNELVQPDYAENVRRHYKDENNQETPIFSMEYPLIAKNGEERWLEHNCRPVFDQMGNYVGRRGNNRDITKQVQATENLILINSINAAVNRSMDLPDLIKTLTEECKRVFNSDSTTVYLYNQDQNLLEMKNLALPASMVKRIEKLIGLRIPSIHLPVEEGSLTQELLQSDGPRIINDPEIIQKWILEFINAGNLSDKSRLVIRKLISRIYKLVGSQSLITVPMISDGKPVGLMDFSRREPFTEEDAKRVAGVVGQVTAAITRLQAMEKKVRSQRLLLTVSDAAQAVQLARTPEEVYRATGREAAKMGFKVVFLTLDEDKTNLNIFIHRLTTDLARAIADPTKLSTPDYSFPIKPEGYFNKIITNKEPVFISDDSLPLEEILPHISPKATEKVIDIMDKKQMITAPLIVGGEVLTLVSFASSDLRESDVPAITAFANQAAIAIENTQLYQETDQRLKKMTALNKIDQAITGSFDLEIILNIILENLLEQLEVDAAAVLSYQEDLQTLQFTNGRGFQTSFQKGRELRLGEGYAGRVALQREHILVPDLSQDQGKFKEPERLLKEKFVSFYGVPLIVKGKMVGVLEIFHRSTLDPDTEWENYLQVMASHIAIAIDNITLFNDLQRSNVDLTLAYDATIEGWARALELKDLETVGHSRRVVELTMKLARKMEISSEKITHIRRGALLHDIGKMGVPDSIIQKPGKLTDEEWQIMRKHPVYAYDWLSPIEYLYPALDIPYCHHERWDGTGYPRGLESEQIPLEARIFAIVDVWDALRSDRPYRKAWSKEKTIAHIKEESGKHFDPQVVDVFLELLRSQ